MPKALKIMGLLYFVGSLSGGSSFAQTPSESHVSVTGAIFAQDSSNPKLGEAYVDPRGLVWSEVSRNDDDLQIKKMNFFDASKDCFEKEARLPTRKEYLQLAIDLGKGSPQGYNPRTTDGKTEVLPLLA